MPAARKNLRAVKADEKPKPVRKVSVSEAAASGDHRALLVAMRDRIAQTVSHPECPPRDLASLTRRLQDIAKELEALDLRAKQEADEDATAPDEDWDPEDI